MEEAIIASGVRTAIGSFGGSLAAVHSRTMGGAVIKEALDRAGVEADQVGEVLMGCALQAGLGMNIARQAAADAGLPQSVPATTINMVCGSGLKAVVLAAQAIRAGDGEIVVAGGVENMSMAPYLLKGARGGYRLGDGVLEDALLKDGLICALADCHMGDTAENVAAKFGVSREDQDAFAASSQAKAATAIVTGRFRGEIVPIQVRKGNETVEFDTDEHPRPATTVEVLAGLRTAFQDAGTVTAGNASGINDGAAAVLVMSRRKAEALGVEPLAEIKAGASVGVDPRIMGMGPVAAVTKVLANGSYDIAGMDLIEVNEAFAAQTLAVGRKLGWDWERVNVNGGAIALGHPVGASGARILVTLLHELKARDLKRGLATLCVGGGQGIAMVIERPG